MINNIKTLEELKDFINSSDSFGYNACDVVKADALHPAGYNVFYPGFLERCRERKRLLHVWTINEEKHMRMLCEAGVDALITNYPDIAKKIRDEYRFGELQPELVQRILQS